MIFITIISDKIAISSSLTKPIAIPATGFQKELPSIKAKEEAHTVAIEEEPLDSVTSDTTLTVYENLLVLALHELKLFLLIYRDQFLFYQVLLTFQLHLLNKGEIM